MTNTPTTDLVKNTLDEFTNILLDKVFDKLYEKANKYMCEHHQDIYAGSKEYETLKAIERAAEERYDLFKEMVQKSMDDMTMTLWRIEMDETSKC